MVDSYNKYTKGGQGTLIENWFEERELREQTGFSRNYPMEHVPKTKEGPAYMRDRDGTSVRVLGEGEMERGKVRTFNNEYGRSRNPADALRKVGLREQQLIAAIQQEVTEEVFNKTQQEEAKRQQRFLDTTNRTTFDWKQHTQEPGRRVMKTQDGAPTNANDEVFMIEMGFGKPLPRRSRQELEDEVRNAQHPVTLYTDTLPEQVFPISATKGANPLAKTSGFTQPLNHTRAANGHQGNI